MYLIPANTKSGALILNVFKPFDLILLGSGIAVTVILLSIIPTTNIVFTLMVLLPAVICAFLVLPIPNYHNVLTVLTGAFYFFSERRKFIWKGWCIYGEEAGKK